MVHKRARRKPATRRRRFKLSGIARFPFISCGFSLVVAQRPAQPRVPLDDLDLFGAGRRLRPADGNRFVADGQRPVVFALVRSEPIVVVDVGLDDAVDLPQTLIKRLLP